VRILHSHFQALQQLPLLKKKSGHECIFQRRQPKVILYLVSHGQQQGPHALALVSTEGRQQQQVTAGCIFAEIACSRSLLTIFEVGELPLWY